MNTQEIERLHDRAVGCYVQGRYDEARDAWEEILQAAPGEARALEGVQLLGALTRQSRPQVRGACRDSPENGSDVMEPSEIEALLRSGRYREALDAAKAHERAHPGEAAAKALCCCRALEKVEAEPFIAGELARGRGRAGGGRPGSRAGRLRLDPVARSRPPRRACPQKRAEERAGAPPAAAPGAVRMAPRAPRAAEQPEELTDEVVEEAGL